MNGIANVCLQRYQNFEIKIEKEKYYLHYHIEFYSHRETQKSQGMKSHILCQTLCCMCTHRCLEKRSAG